MDIVAHGGDLLYRSRVPGWLTEAALAPLRAVAASGVPVLLVPGNHERARIPHPLLAIHDGLHVFDRPRSVIVEARGVRVAFAGFPYTWDARRRFREVLAAATRDVPRAAIRVLCLHQCIEGATCGPGNFTFRDGPDVIPAADLPRDVAAILSGHIHRHQVLRLPGYAPVIDSGSIERTSFAEASETKGFVLLTFTPSGLGGFEFQPLPARPMVTRSLTFEGLGPAEAHARLAEAIRSTPGTAIVRLRISGLISSPLTATTIRSLAGSRHVMVRPVGTDARSAPAIRPVRVRVNQVDH